MKQELDYEDERLRKQIADAQAALERCIKELTGQTKWKPRQGIEKRSDLGKHGSTAGSAGAPGAAKPPKTENPARTDSDLPDWANFSRLEALAAKTKDGLDSGQGSNAECNEESSEEKTENDEMLGQDSDMDSEEEDEKEASSEEEQEEEEPQELAEDENFIANGDVDWGKMIALEEDYMDRRQRPRKQKKKVDCELEVYTGMCDDAEEKADEEEEEYELEQFWRDWDMVRS